MKRSNNENKGVKIPPLSPESVTLAFVAVFCFQENSQMLHQFIQSIFMLQEPKKIAKDLEETIKKQILPAAQMTCALPLVEKLLLEEHSARAAVSFIYIIMRLIYQKMGATALKPAESRDLWKRIWEMARLFPVIEKEWKRSEEAGDLRGWQLEMQEHAREKWKYFSRTQLPQTNERISRLYEKIQTFLSLSPAE